MRLRDRVERLEEQTNCKHWNTLVSISGEAGKIYKLRCAVCGKFIDAFSTYGGARSEQVRRLRERADYLDGVES